ncbi:MAG TPA: hypothetical protein VH475_30115, partial [Tepidisphaeraceae bacterium]
REENLPGRARLCGAVLRTYVERPAVWWLPAVNMACCVLLSEKFAADYVDMLFFPAFLCAVASAFLAASITGHMVQLLAPARGQVTPGLRSSALTVAIVLSIAAVLLPALLWTYPAPSAIPGGIGLRRLHALPLVALLAAQLAWTQVAPVVSALSLFAWTVLWIGRFHDSLMRMLWGRFAALEWAVGAVAVGMFVGLWIVLGRRRERTGGADPIAEYVVRRLFREKAPGSNMEPDGMIPALARPGASGARTRRRLGREAACGGIGACRTGLLAGGLLTLWMVTWRVYEGSALDAMTPAVTCLIVSAIAPMLVAVTAIENRGALFNGDLMLPRSRRQFVRELGLGMFANQLSIWACGVAPAVMTAALVSGRPPEGAGSAVSFVARVLVTAGAYQVFTFGAIGWVLRLSSWMACVLVLIAVGSCGVVIVMSGVERRGGGPAGVLLIAVGLAVAGVVMSLAAYRRWTRAETPWVSGAYRTGAVL